MLVASLLGLGFVWQQYKAQQTSTAVIVKASDRQISPKTASVKNASDAASPAELKQVASIVDTLITPWQPLMLAIERADMPDITLLSIDPNIKKQQVLLVGEAKNLQTVLRYIEQLEAQAELREVYLQKHMVEETDVSKPVTFGVLAKWKVSQ